MQRIIALGLVTGMLTACGISLPDPSNAKDDKKKTEKSESKPKSTGKKHSGAGFSLSLPEDIVEKSSGKTVESEKELSDDFEAAFSNHQVHFSCDGKDLGDESFADVKKKPLKGIIELQLTSETHRYGLKTLVAQPKSAVSTDTGESTEAFPEKAPDDECCSQPEPIENWGGDDSSGGKDGTEEWGDVVYGEGEGGSYEYAEATGETITIPYTCEGNMNVSIDNLQGDSFQIKATLFDSEGLSMYQGDSSWFQIDTSVIDLVMNKITKGMVDVHVIFAEEGVSTEPKKEEEAPAEAKAEAPAEEKSAK